MIRNPVRKRLNSGTLLSCAALFASAVTDGAEPGPATPAAGAKTPPAHAAVSSSLGPPGAPTAPATPPPGETGKRPPDGDKAKNATEITAHELNFNSKANVGVFTGDVTVVSPDFNVKCEKLTAYLRHADAIPKPGADPKSGAPAGNADGGKPAVTPGPAPKPAATPAPATPPPKGKAPPGGAADPDQKGSRLEKAVAEGGVLITQDKKNADGTIEHDTGHAQRAFYDATTGNVTLTGRPDVQQGGNLCVALDDTTIMILNRNGNLRVHGPHKSVLIDNSSPEPDPKNSNAH